MGTDIVQGSRSEQKEALQQSINKYLSAIDGQLGDFKKIGKDALVIGGIVVAAYAITELLLPDEKPKSLALEQQEEDEADSFVWAAVKGAASTVLLTLAKEKLVGLIANLTAQDAQPNS